MILTGTTGPAWRLLLCEDDVSVDRKRVRRVFVRFDAVHQHTTYYRSFEDVLLENRQFFDSAKIRELDVVGACSLDPGVWMGAYYPHSVCILRENAIYIVLTEHVFPQEESSGPAQRLCGGRKPLSFPQSDEVANTCIPLIRSSVWTKDAHIAEYLGVTKTRVQSAKQFRRASIIGPYMHENGLIYQFEMRTTNPMECLPLIQAGTWEFYIPEGESPEYWRSEYDPTTDYPVLGKHGGRVDAKICRSELRDLLSIVPK